MEMSECTYTATWGKCNREFCRKAKSDHFGTARRCYDPQRVATATAAYTQAEEMLAQRKAELAQRKAELAQRISELEVEAKAKAEVMAREQEEVAWQRRRGVSNTLATH